MLAVLGRRLLIAIPIVFLVSLLTFFLVPLLPGDPAAQILGSSATADQLAELRASLGLNDPIMVRYFNWLGSALTGDLGISYYTGSNVLANISVRLPVTLALTIGATALSVVLGVLIGAIGALRGGIVDRLVQSASVLGMALPNFWLALVLVLLFAIWLPLLPASGYVPFATDPGMWFKTLLLPVIALGFASTTAIALQARASIADLAHRDFVKILRAKGVPRRTIIARHLLRNASGPVLTVTGIQFVGMAGSAVVIEQVFALPGLGSLIYTSVTNLDIPVMQAVVVVMTLIVVIVNLVTELAAAALNPKLR